MKQQATPCPNIALRVLLLAFSQGAHDQDIAYIDDEEIDVKKDVGKKLKNTKMAYSEELTIEENVSRDVFYDFQSFIESIAGCIDDFQTKEDNEEYLSLGVDWGEYFDAKNAKVLFSFSNSDKGCSFDEVWVGNPDKGWMIKASSSVFGVYDQSCDISADFNFYTGFDKKELQEHVHEKILKTVQSETKEFAVKMENLKNFLPHAEDDIGFLVESSMKEHEVFLPVVLSRQKKRLNKEIGEKPLSSPKQKM